MPSVAASPQHHHSGGGLRMEDTALATRWSPPEKDMEGHANNILWAAVCRDDVLLTEVSADESVKIPYAGRRMLRKEAKTGFDFYTYTISSVRIAYYCLSFIIIGKASQLANTAATHIIFL
jgi:hypothetical protein